MARNPKLYALAGGRGSGAVLDERTPLFAAEGRVFTLKDLRAEDRKTIETARDQWQAGVYGAVVQVGLSYLKTPVKDQVREVSMAEIKAYYKKEKNRLFRDQSLEQNLLGIRYSLQAKKFEESRAEKLKALERSKHLLILIPSVKPGDGRP